MSVGEFSERLREYFKRIHVLDSIGIRGEISEFRRTQYSTFFTLKDANGVLQCTAPHFKSDKFPAVTHGTEIVAYGSVRINVRQSRYEMSVERIELFGVGALYQQYEALKERFRREGLFATERKRRLPAFPQHVALISARGKGAEDFQRVMSVGAAHVRVEMFETRVQGAGAEVEIREAFDRANASRADLIVLARGGGSYEDLFTFNCEPVVRAILRARVPVVTGIGHTGDHHLADDVADAACETPSNAGQLIVGLWHRGQARLDQLGGRLNREAADVLARAIQRRDDAGDRLDRAWERPAAARIERLRRLERSLDAAGPGAQLRAGRERLSRLDARFAAWQAAETGRRHNDLARRTVALHGLRDMLATYRTRVQLREAGLDRVDPTAPLERGYAIVTSGGAVVRDAAALQAGDAIRARLARGTATARVEGISNDD